MRFTVLCNPENRRVRFFREAVRARGGSCEILPWAEFLRGDREIDAEHPIRIESPGENWAVESALLGRSEPEDRGRIRGLEPAYDRLVGALGELPDAQYFTRPKAIAAMFDKLETKRRLDEIGVPTPRTYGLVRSFDELAEVMAANRQRAFVKPRHGSSASGVIALSLRPDKVLATTSVERAGGKLYNSLKIRRYHQLDEVRRIVDLLGAEDELIVEEWVPKGSTQGATFDLRIVAIGAQADHAVLRLSAHPMTNLHLGNTRGDLVSFRRELGDGWQRLQELALRALAAFDGALYAGVDVALTPDRKRAVVFEVNAFGDLLPGIVDHRGWSTYEAELELFMSRNRT